MVEKGSALRWFIVITVVSVYLLILAGGIVRTTGSGMGCPDWPKCFGYWVPPTDESELPDDYKITYSVQGHEADFNPVKTWIEYVNRLLGALIGVFVIITFVLSLRYKFDSKIKWFCGTALFLTILEGVIGKYVVSTNLRPWVISFHLWGSIIIILLLIYVMCEVRKDYFILESRHYVRELSRVTVFLIIVTVIQIVIGTQVRQQIDTLSFTLGFAKRNEWVSGLDSSLTIHGMFSYLVLFGHVYFMFRLKKIGVDNLIRRFGLLLMFFVLVEMIGGIVMVNYNIPAFIQPIHMLIATMLLGVQFFLLFVLKLNSKKEVLK